MDINKISSSLAENINNSDATTNLEAILEIASPSPLLDKARSKQERISSIKASFQQDAEPIEQIIKRNGGEVINQAWINKTMRVRVSTECLKKLSDLDKVTSIDTPHMLTSDYKD